MYFISIESGDLDTFPYLSREAHSVAGDSIGAFARLPLSRFTNERSDYGG